MTEKEVRRGKIRGAMYRGILLAVIGLAAQYAKGAEGEKNFPGIVGDSGEISTNVAGPSGLAETAAAGGTAAGFNAIDNATVNVAANTTAGTTTESTSTLTAQSAGLSKPDLFQTSASVIIGTSATVNSAEPTSTSGSYQLILGLKRLNTPYSASVSAGYVQNYSKEIEEPEYGSGETGDFEDSVVGIKQVLNFKGQSGSKRILKPGEDPNLSAGASNPIVFVGVSSVLPTSELSRKRTLRGSLGPQAGYIYSLGRWTFQQTAGYRYAFYRYDVRDNGIVNSPHQLSLQNGISFAVSEQVSFSLDLLYRYSLSFQNVGRDQTLTSVSVDWSPHPKVGVSVGVSTLAGTLSPDGTSTRLNLYDPGLAEAFVDFSLSL